MRASFSSKGFNLNKRDAQDGQQQKKSKDNTVESRRRIKSFPDMVVQLYPALGNIYLLILI